MINNQNKNNFYGTLNIFLNKRCKCILDLNKKQYHYCNITQFELYKNVKNYNYIEKICSNIEKNVLDIDDDIVIINKIKKFLNEDSCKLDKKEYELFSLILVSMISRNEFKRNYKGPIIKYFHSKL